MPSSTTEDPKDERASPFDAYIRFRSNQGALFEAYTGISAAALTPFAIFATGARAFFELSDWQSVVAYVVIGIWCAVSVVHLCVYFGRRNAWW